MFAIIHPFPLLHVGIVGLEPSALDANHCSLTPLQLPLRGCWCVVGDRGMYPFDLPLCSRERRNGKKHGNYKSHYVSRFLEESTLGSSPSFLANQI